MVTITISQTATLIATTLAQIVHRIDSASGIRRFFGAGRGIRAGPAVCGGPAGIRRPDGGLISNTPVWVGISREQRVEVVVRGRRVRDLDPVVVLVAG